MFPYITVDYDEGPLGTDPEIVKKSYRGIRVRIGRGADEEHLLFASGNPDVDWLSMCFEIQKRGWPEFLTSSSVDHFCVDADYSWPTEVQVGFSPVPPVIVKEKS